MTRPDVEVPAVYALFVRLALRPWLDSAERADVLRDVAELRDAYRARHGARGLSPYTWRQLLQYPAQLARPSSPRRREARVDSITTDFRTAFRMLRRSPLLTITVIAILAVAVSANSTIFGIVNAVLIEPLPFPEPERIVALWYLQGGQRARLAPGTLVDARELDAFEQVGAFMGISATFTPEDGEPELLRGSRVTSGYFEALGRAPLAGYWFEPHHFDRGEEPVIIVGHDVWTRRFQADPRVVGRQMAFGDTRYRIVGVMPPGIYPLSATLEGTLPLRPGGPDFWVPIRFQDEFYGNRRSQILGTVARLAPGVTTVQATASLTAGTAALQADGRLPEERSLTMNPLRQEAVGSVSRPLTLLLVTVGVVLVIAAANVAALLLTRAEAAQGELAVRAALGAGRWRLVRLQLFETLLLATAGGALGIAATPWLLDIVRAAIPAQIPRLDSAEVSGAVMLFTTATIIGVTLLAGLAPALLSTRAGLLRSLQRVSTTRTADRGRRRLQSGLVVAQTALAVVLVIASAVLVRSFLQLSAVDLGFRQQGVLTVRLSAPASVADDPDETAAFWRSLRDTLAGTPGVAEVGLGSDRPVERSWLDTFVIEGAPEGANGGPASLRRLGPGYLAALDVPVLAGRDVSPADLNDTAPVAVINESAARTYFGDADPIGQRITIPSLANIGFAGEVAATREIVGVVGDIHHLGPTQAADPSIYLPLQQFEAYSAVAVIREDGSRPDTAAAVREALRGVDRTLAVRGIERLPALVGDFTARERFATVLVSCFGIIGLVLSAMSLYALVARTVSLRTREYGLRLAVGAPPGALVGDVFKTALRPVTLGVMIGMASAAPVTAAMRSQLFGIEALDPLSFATAPFMLLVVAASAGLLVGRRALRVDPATALRADG